MANSFRPSPGPTWQPRSGERAAERSHLAGVGRRGRPGKTRMKSCTMPRAQSVDLPGFAIDQGSFLQPSNIQERYSFNIAGLPSPFFWAAFAFSRDLPCHPRQNLNSFALFRLGLPSLSFRGRQLLRPRVPVRSIGATCSKPG